jgi:hypothetical protein
MEHCMIARIQNAKPVRVAKTGAKIAAVVAMGLFALSGSASSQSITPNSVNPVQHFLDCFGAMISNPAAHAADCSPGHDAFVSGSTGFAAGSECRTLTLQLGNEVQGDNVDESCLPNDDD